ncbi:MAG: hypothetical protein U0838_11430 [Chloroflexota bacterium]
MPEIRTPSHRPIVPVSTAVRPDLATRRRRGKPESNGVRMVIGLAGLASASALATAMLPSIAPQPAAITTAEQVDTAALDPTQQPDPSIIHVTHVITLKPGQTLPPDALVNQTPAPATPKPKATPRPTPRVIIHTVTKQSGKP